MTRFELSGPAALQGLLRRDPGLFAVTLLTLGFDLAVRVAGRYLPAYLQTLGATPWVVGLVWSGWLLLRAVYPYVGRRVLAGLDRRYVLSGFGVVTTVGLLLWVAAPQMGSPTVLGLTVGPWLWVGLGLACAATWRSHGPGVLVSVTELSVPTGRLATRLATTWTFRRVGIVAGLVVLAGLFAVAPTFRYGFQLLVALVTSFGLAATVGQAVMCDSEVPLPLREPPPAERVVSDFRTVVSADRMLLLGDALFRFARGMFYPFLVLAVADLGVTASALGVTLGSAAAFAVLLGAETVTALFAAIPITRNAEDIGTKPIVGVGCLAVALFPLALVSAPPNLFAFATLFAVFGIGTATRPVRKRMLAHVVRESGNHAPESVRLARRLVVVPSALVGGILYGISPTLGFGLATAVGLLGCWEFFGHVR